MNKYEEGELVNLQVKYKRHLIMDDHIMKGYHIVHVYIDKSMSTKGMELIVDESVLSKLLPKVANVEKLSKKKAG